MESQSLGTHVALFFIFELECKKMMSLDIRNIKLTSTALYKTQWLHIEIMSNLHITCKVQITNISDI